MSDAELDQLQKEFRGFREGHERAHAREKATPPHAPVTHELGISTEPRMTKDYRVTKPCKFA